MPRLATSTRSGASMTATGTACSLARLARTLARGAASRERVLEVLASDQVVPEDPDALPAPPLGDRLAVRDVSFAYSAGTPVLHDLRLEILAGEHVCVVGPTGAGKSTLLGLLLRFHDSAATPSSTSVPRRRGRSSPACRPASAG